MEAHAHKKVRPPKRERGQGLVEMVLVLPFLLILVVGVVEAGLALNRQLTVVNAAREGARFGAFGASPGDIHTQTLLATSQMFDFTEENAVVAVIHAETSATTPIIFTEWTENKYPADATVPHVTQGEVLEQLQAEGDAAHLKLVVVDVRYDHQSMLGLPFVGALADQIPIGSWTVMRIPSLLGNPGEGGCCVVPITLNMETVQCPTGPDPVQLPDIRIGDGPGMFGWIYWDPDENGSAVNLEENLRNACIGPPTQFKNACDPEDTTLDIGDWISGDSGESVATDVRDEVEALKGKYIRIPVWGPDETGWSEDGFEACNDMPPDCVCRTGKQIAHVVAFAIVEITEVNLTANPKTISATFIRCDNGCE